MIQGIQSIETNLLELIINYFLNSPRLSITNVTCHTSNPSFILIYVRVNPWVALLCGERIERCDSGKNWFLAFVKTNQRSSKIFFVFSTERNCVISIRWYPWVGLLVSDFLKSNIFDNFSPYR